jgi:hypothetical protein
MGLLQLPGELLDEIITFTLPHGFENFVLSCKAIYARGESKIDRYNRLQSRRRFASQPTHDRGKALQLLYEISCDPLLADFIDVLCLRNTRRDGNQSDASQLTDEFRMEDETMDRIKEIVTRSEWLEHAGVDVEGWWERIMNEDETADEEDSEEELPCTVVSLLSQLPGLKALQLPESWKMIQVAHPRDEEDKQLVYVLDALIKHSHESGERRCPLKELETILPFMPAGYEARAGLQCVEPFLSLRSIKELLGVSLIAVEDGYTGIPFHWRSELHSPLRRIELASCCVDSDGLSSFIAHTPQLEVFKYSHETKWHGCEHDWNPGAVVEALGRHCGSHITELALTIDELYGDIINGASTFLAFTNLKSLEVDVLVFCGPPIESGQRKGIEAYIPPGDIPWTEHDIPCIGSMIPNRVMHLEINTDYPRDDEQALRSLLKNIKQQKEERLHHLEHVIIRQSAGDSAKEVFGVPGLVTITNGRIEGVTSRSMLPSWKRKFAERVGGIENI